LFRLRISKSLLEIWLLWSSTWELLVFISVSFILICSLRSIMSPLWINNSSALILFLQILYNFSPVIFFVMKQLLLVLNLLLFQSNEIIFDSNHCFPWFLYFFTYLFFVDCNTSLQKNLMKYVFKETFVFRQGTCPW